MDHETLQQMLTSSQTSLVAKECQTSVKKLSKQLSEYKSKMGVNGRFDRTFNWSHKQRVIEALMKEDSRLSLGFGFIHSQSSMKRQYVFIQVFKKVQPSLCSDEYEVLQMEEISFSIFE